MLCLFCSASCCAIGPKLNVARWPSMESSKSLIDSLIFDTLPDESLIGCLIEFSPSAVLINDSRRDELRNRSFRTNGGV